MEKEIRDLSELPESEQIRELGNLLFDRDKCYGGLSEAYVDIINRQDIIIRTLLEIEKIKEDIEKNHLDYYYKKINNPFNKD